MGNERDAIDRFDLVIVGAGMGGCALAWALRATNVRICIIERGGPLKQETANWDPDAVITERRYDPREEWYDEANRPFVPRVYYNYGGSSKFFGGTSFRLRESDFAARRYREGSTHPWPFGYEELVPHYNEAERAMWVHGEAGVDPTEPPRGPYPYAPLSHEQPIAWLAERLSRQGLHPFPLPIAVHQGDGGHCRKGSPCDGFPCKIRAKGDGENAFLRPALRAHKGITMVPHTRVERLITDEAGVRVIAAEVVGEDGERRRIAGDLFALAAGAAHSAAILLRSATARHPAGLANGSGQVGRNFMAHNNTVLMALSPLRRNPTRFQKTLAINDYYDGGGNVQMRGKVLPQNLARSSRPLRRLLRRWIAERSFDFWLMSEDLPDPENRVEVRDDGAIRLRRRLNNGAAHKAFVRRFRRRLRRAGLWIVLKRPPSPSAIQHQVGTLRAGTDPADSVVDARCRAHEVENLYVVDGSIFPSSAAVNPALTIAANSLRVGRYLREEVFGRKDG